MSRVKHALFRPPPPAPRQKPPITAPKLDFPRKDPTPGFSGEVRRAQIRFKAPPPSWVAAPRSARGRVPPHLATLCPPAAHSGPADPPTAAPAPGRTKPPGTGALSGSV